MQSDVVMNPFIFLLTCNRANQFGKVITLINSDWKAELHSQREQCTVNGSLINSLISRFDRDSLQLEDLGWVFI